MPPETVEEAVARLLAQREAQGITVTEEQKEKLARLLAIVIEGQARND